MAPINQCISRLLPTNNNQSNLSSPQNRDAPSQIYYSMSPPLKVQKVFHDANK